MVFRSLWKCSIKYKFFYTAKTTVVKLQFADEFLQTSDDKKKDKMAIKLSVKRVLKLACSCYFHFNRIGGGFVENNLRRVYRQ